MQSTRHRTQKNVSGMTSRPANQQALEGGSSYGQHSLTATNFVAINNEMQ
jgi:hypothetical protein